MAGYLPNDEVIRGLRLLVRDGRMSPPQYVMGTTMGLLFEQIDSQPSSLGEITLRRRRIPALGDRDIYEVKLGEEFLMSSMFVDAEVALADLGLNAVEGEQLKVVVGGLGLGYTAEAALKHERVSELLVVDALDTVIHWHQQEKVPLGKVLNADPRCRYVLGSFFDLAVSESGFDTEISRRIRISGPKYPIPRNRCATSRFTTLRMFFLPVRRVNRHFSDSCGPIRTIFSRVDSYRSPLAF